LQRPDSNEGYLQLGENGYLNWAMKNASHFALPVHVLTTKTQDNKNIKNVLKNFD